MSISIVSLLVDFGLVVLIWIIQLIIYPSFQYYQKANLIRLHRKYTVLIGFVVLPLMILQLGFAIYETTVAATVLGAISLILIVLVWISTFLQFVPLHNAVSKGSAGDAIRPLLVKKNWLRTGIWTMVFIVNVVTFTTI